MAKDHFKYRNKLKTHLGVEKKNVQCYWFIMKYDLYFISESFILGRSLQLS